MNTYSFHISEICKMSKYIAEFNQIGISIVNIGFICKDWNDRFSISTWENEETEYTFIIHSKIKGKRLCKTQISKEQALEIISKLNLIHVKSSLIRSGGAYHSKNFIKQEFDRIYKIKQEKEQELAIINRILNSYNACF